MGTTIAFSTRPGWAVAYYLLDIICNFWHPGTLTLSPERQSARMSKITNDGLTHVWLWHRMLYSCTQMATVGVKGLKPPVSQIFPPLAVNMFLRLLPRTKSLDRTWRFPPLSEFYFSFFCYFSIWLCEPTFVSFLARVKCSLSYHIVFVPAKSTARAFGRICTVGTSRDLVASLRERT